MNTLLLLFTFACIIWILGQFVLLKFILTRMVVEPMWSWLLPLNLTAYAVVVSLDSYLFKIYKLSACQTAGIILLVLTVAIVSVHQRYKKMFNEVSIAAVVMTSLSQVAGMILMYIESFVRLYQLIRGIL